MKHRKYGRYDGNWLRGVHWHNGVELSVWHCMLCVFACLACVLRAYCVGRTCLAP